MTELERRDVLRGAAGVTALALLPTATSAAESVVDKTGQKNVTVEVGVKGNGGSYAFGPEVVRIDPGTTVTWKWTGNGGMHNVAAADGSFKSELHSDAGATFEHTFESEGAFEYACEPHEALGMTGAVLVGDVSFSAGKEEQKEETNDVTDKTGQEEVTVTVGAEGNGGFFTFSPATMRIDPGTTVVWKWSGNGGMHNVVAKDGAFESELQGDAGATFEHTFESEGAFEYACEPHEALGMTGTVLVGDASLSDSSGDSSLGEPDYGDWFDDVDNFDGTVDMTGKQSVTIDVGAEANGGAFGFGPAAVRIDPGTTVTWKWTGNGGTHNVVAEDGSFGSEMYGTGGATFEHTFEETGIAKYACEPHKAMGMKGAIVVGGAGGASANSLSPGELALGGSFVTALLSPVAFALFLFARRERESIPSSWEGGKRRHRPQARSR